MSETQWCTEPLCTTTARHHVHTDADGRSWCCDPYPYTATEPARPVGGDTREALREEIAATMFAAEMDQPCTWAEADEIQRVDYLRMTDAVLALPAVRDAIDAQEKLRRVEHEAGAFLREMSERRHAARGSYDDGLKAGLSYARARINAALDPS